MPPYEGVALNEARVAHNMDSAAIGDEHSQRDLNFGGAVPCEEEEECFPRRSTRDPMSHRIIEKRRRDRMNSCLADLSRLIPAEYLRRGRGRIEKTEIIEMAIRHMRHMHESQPFSPMPSSSSPGSTTSFSSSSLAGAVSCRQEACEAADDSGGSFGSTEVVRGEGGTTEQYRLGFLECLSETLHFLVEVEGFPASGALCHSLGAHLHAHCAAMLKGDKTPSPRAECGLNGQLHFNVGASKGKTEQLGFELPVSEEEPEAIMHQTESQDYEEIEPTELNDILTQKDQGRNSSTSHSPPIFQESGSSYKFKNNIKRRFTAGLKKRKRTEEGEIGGDEECYEDASVLGTHSPRCTLLPCTAHPQSDDASNQIPHIKHQDSVPSRVPVFALHSEHSFYVPLMLEPETLAPHASLLSKQAPVLHPVTISVNFCNRGDGEYEKSCTRSLSALRVQLPPSTTPLPPLSLTRANTHRHWKPSQSYDCY